MITDTTQFEKLYPYLQLGKAVNYVQNSAENTQCGIMEDFGFKQGFKFDPGNTQQVYERTALLLLHSMYVELCELPEAKEYKDIAADVRQSIFILDHVYNSLQEIRSCSDIKIATRIIYQLGRYVGFEPQEAETLFYKIADKALNYLSSYTEMLDMYADHIPDLLRHTKAISPYNFADMGVMTKGIERSRVKYYFIPLHKIAETVKYLISKGVINWESKPPIFHTLIAGPESGKALAA